MAESPSIAGVLGISTRTIARGTAEAAAESSTYDDLGRRATHTDLAGHTSTLLEDGLTTQYLYDDHLGDGVGLDGGGGVGLFDPADGSATSVSLAAAITKLAEPIASSGRGL